ncbi:MAG TPA: peptide deformylase [Candidatus Omnitrophota bacterium]|nr:peptide deformylase [Candidatus Omnitrophota bacterium]HPD84219.1 peptide deformylase [Candidatus Omnitrophota bacterium]HRZ03075.1 peptide deformylase [Candidatus Omnitrophota bacterium]
MIATKLKIRLCSDPCLRKKSVPIKAVDASTRLLITSMLETMYDGKGIGLAAPQVGINERLIVVDIGDGPVALINPKITKRSGQDIMEEGCLSVPGIVVEIKRPAKIRVEYLDENNQPQAQDLAGLMARVVLHETDHLNGKLIIDYASWAQKLKFKKKLKEIKKNSVTNSPVNF